MRKGIAVLLLVILLIALGAGAQAQEPAAGDRANRDQILKLLDAMKSRDLIKTIKNAQRTQIGTMMHGMVESLNRADKNPLSPED